jgi:hypothetical protein
MRDITEVIDRMIGATPDDESEFKERLGHVRRAALFTAPEAMAGRWRHVQEVFGGRFKDVDVKDFPEWGHAVGRILAGID